MPDLLDKKLKHFFALMDRDGTNTLKLNDYMISADQVSTSFGHRAKSDDHAELRRWYTHFWAEVIKPMDADGDDRVTWEEYLSAYNAKVRGNPEGYLYIRPIVDAIVKIADTASDGKITPDNFTTAMTAGFSVPESESRATFADMDEQKNGYLTTDQIHAAAEGYFMNTDPSAAGNSLFGKY